MAKIKPEQTSLLFILVMVLFLAVFLGCAPGPETSPAEEPTADEPASEEADEPMPPSGKPFATVDTSEGQFTIELLPDVAPAHVERFVTLARAGFYYNTTFHRVIADTLIQGGDPKSKDADPYNDGTGNTGTFLDAEFSELPFERGTVAMARQQTNKNSASCQFFVTLKRIEGWDGEYTIFGKVVDGIEVIEKMANSPRSKDARLKERPTAKLTIRRIKIEYRDV